jgi:hypothetical protein
MTDRSELLPLEALESFGWIFTPGPLPGNTISAADAIKAAGVAVGQAPRGDTSVESGTYTEKGRYRQEAGERRITLYYEHPVWVITTVADAGEETSGASLRAKRAGRAERYSRHTLVDAHSGRRITQFLLVNDPGDLQVLDLHQPLSAPEMTLEEAVTAAISGEERLLTGLPRTAEYGSRWRLIPGFVQVTDVWRVTFDTSSLPPPSPTARPEVAWVVVVDDKAGHRWLSAAVEKAAADTAQPP